jgi:hypothetical protein
VKPTTNRDLEIGKRIQLKIDFEAWAPENIIVKNGTYITVRGRVIRDHETFIVLSRTFPWVTFLRGTVVEFIGIRETTGELGVWDIPQGEFVVLE